jgi:hypothetical protein
MVRTIPDPETGDAWVAVEEVAHRQSHGEGVPIRKRAVRLEFRRSLSRPIE